MSENNKIVLPLKKAVAVVFKKAAELDSDGFAENGMTAWLTKIEWDQKVEAYRLYFDFSDFEEINQKYFTESFYTSGEFLEKTGKKTATAIEIGYYSPKESVYLNVLNEKGEYLTERNDILFEKTLNEHFDKAEGVSELLEAVNSLKKRIATLEAQNLRLIQTQSEAELGCH